MFMPTPRATVAPTRFASSTKRYFIMGFSSLPEGVAFTLRASHRHLLTEFAMGNLSVADVVACLTASAPASPLEALRPA